MKSVSRIPDPSPAFVLATSRMLPKTNTDRKSLSEQYCP
jgi:hypothetical protein